MPGISLSRRIGQPSIIERNPGTFTIYTIHPGGNFRCKYSVLQLFQTENGKIRKCIIVSIGKFKKKRKNALIKSTAYSFWNVSNGMVCTISFSNQNSRVFRVNGKRPWTPMSRHRISGSVLFILCCDKRFFILFSRSWCKCGRWRGGQRKQARGSGGLGRFAFDLELFISMLFLFLNLGSSYSSCFDQ